MKTLIKCDKKVSKSNLSSESNITIFPNLNHGQYLNALTDIDEPAGGAPAELLALEAERDLDDAWDVPRRRLHPDRVARDQLTPHQHRAEDHLHTESNERH